MEKGKKEKSKEKKKKKKGKEEIEENKKGKRNGSENQKGQGKMDEKEEKECKHEMSSNPWQLGYPKNKIEYPSFLNPQYPSLITIHKKVLSDQLRLFSPINFGKPSLNCENKKEKEKEKKKKRKKKGPLG